MSILHRFVSIADMTILIYLRESFVTDFVLALKTADFVKLSKVYGLFSLASRFRQS